MGYLGDYRADVRADPRQLLPSARSIICVGKLYQTPGGTQADYPQHGWIARYAQGEDYHRVMADGLEQMASLLREEAGPHEYRVAVDTLPLLERSYAHAAGLGWIGKNTCLINQASGSWYLLGELLTSLDLEPGSPAPDRCGSCTRCIDACPTAALIPDGQGRYVLDAQRCISYVTIEKRGEIPADLRPGLGHHVFGCDICQDVCPWNRRAPETTDPRFTPRPAAQAPDLEQLAAFSPQEFHQWFGETPVTRSRYNGFLRNVAVAMGNAGEPRFRPHLERLARHESEVVAEHARWALARLPGASSP
jgi:epoxyqueuosine reductase